MKEFVSKSWICCLNTATAAVEMQMIYESSNPSGAWRDFSTSEALPLESNDKKVNLSFFSKAE